MNLSREAFADYLDEVMGNDYGRLMESGDPIAFEVGYNEWVREFNFNNDNNNNN
jgi:hypothetical protein